jgi:hypothetical protein
MVQMLLTLDRFFIGNACLLLWNVLFNIIQYLPSNYRKIDDPVVACIKIYDLELKWIAYYLNKLFIFVVCEYLLGTATEITKFSNLTNGHSGVPCMTLEDAQILFYFLH